MEQNFVHGASAMVCFPDMSFFNLKRLKYLIEWVQCKTMADSSFSKLRELESEESFGFLYFSLILLLLYASVSTTVKVPEYSRGL